MKAFSSNTFLKGTSNKLVANEESGVIDNFGILMLKKPATKASAKPPK